MSPEFTTDREELEKEVEVSFYRASGPGGQHRNRTETGVRLFHPPSGLRAQATERRSQRQNLELAFERLIARLEDLMKPVTPRVPTRPSRAAKRKRLDDKKQQGERKANRRRPREDE